MAKVGSLYLKGSKGKLAGATLYKSGSDTKNLVMHFSGTTTDVSVRVKKGATTTPYFVTFLLFYFFTLPCSIVPGGARATCPVCRGCPRHSRE